MRLAVVLGLLLAGAGCGDASSRPPEPEPPPQSCDANELTRPDGCVPVGVPPDQCGQGMEPNGLGGCLPVLPDEPCPAGTMALAGETVCRPVMDCGAGPYEGIPVDAATIYVDPNAPPGGVGSLEQPYASLAQAVTAAPDGALVALAPGTYDEGLEVVGKSLRVWGRCPTDVTIVPSGQPAGAQLLHGDIELHGIGVEAGNAVAISNANVLLEGVWLRASDQFVVLISDELGPTNVTVASSLVEGPANAGIATAGGAVTVTDSVIRDIEAAPPVGVAIAGDAGVTGALPAITVARTVVRRSGRAGISSRDGAVFVDESVITEMPPSGTDPSVAVQIEGAAACAELHVRRSYLSRAGTNGVGVVSASALVEGTTIREIGSASSPDVGLTAIGTQDTNGLGCAGTRVIDSYVDTVAGIGIRNVELPLNVERTIVRDNIQLAGGVAGSGIGVSDGAALTVTDSLVRDSFLVGVLNAATTAAITGTEIHGIRANPDGLFGDGVATIRLSAEGEVDTTIVNSTITDTGRAGVSSFGAAVSLAGTTLRCNVFDLNQQPFVGADPSLSDGGGNTCGCGEDLAPCKVTTQSLEPPAASAP